MRRSTALMGVAAVAVMASNAFAQAKTNFAGTWNQVVDSAAMAQQQGGAGGRGGRGGGAGFGATFSIAQDDKTITIKQTRGQNEIVSVYNLDGSDSKNTVQGRGGATEVISHAKWDGAKLAISTTRDMQGTAVTTTRTLSVDAAGNLWIELTGTGPDGAPMTSKAQYKK